MYENDKYIVEIVLPYGWKIIHKLSNRSVGINFESLPENASEADCFKYAEYVCKIEKWDNIS